MALVAPRRGSLSRSQTTTLCFKDALKSGRVTTTDVNEHIEKEYHSGRPSTAKELINEVLHTILPSVRLSLGRSIASMASEGGVDFGDFVLEVKPINPRDTIDEQHPEQLVSNLSIKLDKVKVRRIKKVVAKPAAAPAAEPAVGSPGSPAANSASPPRGLPPLDMESLDTVGRVRYTVADALVRSGEFLSPRYPLAGQEPSVVGHHTGQLLLTLGERLQPRVQSEGGAGAASARDAAAACLSGIVEGVTAPAEPSLATDSPVPSPPRAVRLGRHKDENALMLWAVRRLQAATRGRAARKAVEEMGWQSVSTIRTAVERAKSRGRHDADAAAEKEPPTPPTPLRTRSFSADFSAGVERRTSSFIVATRRRSSSIALGVRRRASSVRAFFLRWRKGDDEMATFELHPDLLRRGGGGGSDGSVPSGGGGASSMARSGTAGRRRFSIARDEMLQEQNSAAMEADGDDFVQLDAASGEVKNMQALAFDLQLELNLALPHMRRRPKKGSAAEERAAEARTTTPGTPRATPGSRMKKTTHGVPVKFAVVLKGMSLPKIKLQLLDLHLTACARVVHDLKDDELTIGFIKDVYGKGPKLEWDIEARMGKMNLPDFLEDKLPATLVGMLLKNFTPAEPLRVPLDLEDIVKDSIVMPDTIEGLDLEVERLQGELEAMQKKRMRVLRKGGGAPPAAPPAKPLQMAGGS